MLIATWFQFTIVKWCIFVRKAVMIRERRVQQLLHRLEQEDAINLFRQANRVSSRIAQDQLTTNSAEIKITEENKELFKDEVCSICISGFNAGDTARKLVCRHYFHHDCIRMWVVRQSKCPNCNINPFTGDYTEPGINLEHEIAQRNLPWQLTTRAFNQVGL